MKFALNYSPQAADLIHTQQIDIDIYKCPDWPDLVADALMQRPVYVHFPLKAGRGSTPSVDWAKVEHFLESTDTPYINLHLYPRREDFDVLPDDDGIMEYAVRDIEFVGARFGMERVIVENIPYSAHDKGVLAAAIMPKNVRRVVDETGCGFLLDTAHADITARTIGMSVHDYIAQLPLDRLRELHVTGLALHDGELTDHFELQDEDWALLEWVLEHIHNGIWSEPWALVFEYGGISPVFDWRSKSEVILAQVPHLYALAHDLQLEQ